MPRGRPKGSAPPACRQCGNHPRSQAHRNAGCTKPVATAKRVSVKGKKGKYKTVVTEDIDMSKPPEGWVLGRTCITCATTYKSWEPTFQDPDTKHGKYDVTLQLPGTAEDYPQCPRCLPYQWRAQAKRLGVEKKVADVYEGYF